MEDTIVAISTSLGMGAISIIRVSGPNAINYVDPIFTGDLLNKESHTISYGFIKEQEEVIDEVLISVMKAPKTFTMEDTIEINCHGGIAPTKKILELLLKQGCKLAQRGEFTKRAFLNGRIDLTEARAVMDLVNVDSESARKIAMHNLKGKTKDKINKLRKRLLDILTNIEVNIDYPEYLDIEVVTIDKIKKELISIKEELNRLIENSKNSKVITNGIKIAIIGRPNVGKSSILNHFLGMEKAIVTDIPGTTRDIVEGSILLDGLLLHLIDTAGIRDTDDVVEKIGVEKSFETKDEADLVILVLNNAEEISNYDKDLIASLADKKSIIVINKNDLNAKLDRNEIKNNIVLETNTVTDNGLDILKEKIKELFLFDNNFMEDFNYVSSTEQLTKLEEAKESIISIEEGLVNNLPIDIIEIDLKNIWMILGEITGEIYTEELLDALFQDFCVGK